MRNEKGQFIKGDQTNKGRVRTEEMKEKNRLWHLGKHLSPKTEFKKGEHPNSETEFKKGQYSNENNLQWKGEKAGIIPKHIWLIRHYGHPPTCEDCGKIGEYYLCSNGVKVWNIQWSNIDHKYRRVREDYMGRCISCHKIYDIKLKKSGNITTIIGRI